MTITPGIYRLSNGDTYRITRVRPDPKILYPVESDNSEVWTRDGRYFAQWVSIWDLVERVGDLPAAQRGDL